MLKRCFYLVVCAVFLATACTGGTDEPIGPNDPDKPEVPDRPGDDDDSDEPSGVTLEISTPELLFEQEGGTQDFTVTSNGDWEIFCSEDWCKTNFPAGSGNLTVSVMTEAYQGWGDVREAVVTLQSGKKKRELKVKQKPEKAMHIAQDTIHVSADGGTISVKVQSIYDRVEYVVDLPTWISQVQETKAIISATYDFVVERNGIPKKRVGYIIFHDTVNRLEDTVYVVQEKGEIEMVYVEGGTFRMGATYDEEPVHSVTLSDYYIGKYEVTQGLWKAVMGTGVEEQMEKAGESDLYGVGDDYPMYYVSWDEAQEFVSKLSELTGKKYVLPTEAQWEYAARGGVKSRGYKYSGSNTIDDVAWYAGNSETAAHPVGTKLPNELGIYDMSGNVWEWCSDWYSDYSDVSQTDPTGPSSGSGRVFRGGSWLYNARNCRVSNRPDGDPDYRDNNLGFRVALVF